MSEESPVGPEKQDGKTEEEKRKETELEKYWRAVKENSMDFTGWTYLLQYVEQEVREAEYGSGLFSLLLLVRVVWSRVFYFILFCAVVALSLCQLMTYEAG